MSLQTKLSKTSRLKISQSNLFSRNHRGVSPVIATVLLVSMVIAIGLLVFLWFRGWQQESITKFGKNVELVCDDVLFSANYDSYTGELQIVNEGNINLADMSVKISKDGSYETKSLKDDFDGWPAIGLSAGGAVSIDLNLDVSVVEISVIPVIAGSSDSGNKIFTCGSRHGKEITI